MPASSAPLVVAHRGASGAAPENTLPAFELAWELGADAIEGDFRLTADGHIVCIHDANTDRVSEKNLSVGDSTLAQLRELDLGSWKGEQWRGTRISTLGEVLASIPPEKKIFIELKAGIEILPALLASITTSPLEPSQIVVIAFDDTLIAALKAQAPALTACWLSGFKQSETGVWSPSRESMLETLASCSADGLGSSREIPADFVSALHDAGLIHDVWTVDSLHLARKFAALGTRAITTNYPDRLTALRD
jgi:glycerophosphoryl diester phosphodiesterase